MRNALVLALAATTLSACTATQTAPAMGPPPPAPAAANDADAVAAERIKPFQYLYGSGEAAAVSIGTWHALAEFARRQVAQRPVDSVVLAEGSTLAEARFIPCGAKPFAAALA